MVKTLVNICIGVIVWAVWKHCGPAVGAGILALLIVNNSDRVILDLKK